jgi:hypothetical protein
VRQITYRDVFEQMQRLWLIATPARLAAQEKRRQMEIEHDQTRERAYQLWEQAGKPDGKHQYFWNEAERQLREELIRHELKTPDTL